MGFYSNVLYQNDLKEIADHIVNPERLKGKRILITGANGLIASYIVDTLLWLNDNHDYNTDVYALVRTKEKAERRFFENLNNEHFRIVLQDVTQPLLNVDCPFDYVVHAACNAHPLAYATTPVEVIKSNITGTENVLNYMLTHGGGKMVFVSSSEVYGENKAADSLTESMYGYIDITNPRSCYSESKRAAESLCVSFSKEYNIDVCMVRPGFIFGPAVPSDNSRADAQFLRNAIAHKDYTGSDIQMHVFDDRLEIWNEGELPVGYDQQTLFARHSSKPRNRNIANAFFKAGFIDTWGRGFQKIQDGFEPAGIPMPTVENFCGGVRVTIQRTKFMQMMNVTSDVTSDVTSNVSSDVSSSVGSLSVVQLSDRQKKMRELILKDSFISAQQMSVVLSVVPRTIWRDLADLQKKGVLVREGNTSAGHWIWVGATTENDK